MVNKTVNKSYKVLEEKLASAIARIDDYDTALKSHTDQLGTLKDHTEYNERKRPT